jgi:hypothetical protein
MTSSPLSPIRAVLFVPSEAHREALLADGVCGARVPSAYWHRGGIEAIPEPGWRANPAHLPPGNALVLAFDGRVVREGRDRLAYVMLDAAGWDPGSAAAAPFWRAVHVGTRAAWRAVGFAWVLDGEQNPIGFGYPDNLPNDLVGVFDVVRVCAARGLGRVEVVRG